MPTCQNCGEKWGWIQTIKTLFKLECPYCGKKQYESTSSRQRSSLFILMPMLIIILPVSSWLGLPMSIAFILAIILGVVLIFGLYPFILNLSNEQEPFW